MAEKSIRRKLVLGRVEILSEHSRGRYMVRFAPEGHVAWWRRLFGRQRGGRS